MKKLMTNLMMVAALLVAGVAHAEAQLGKDYAMLNPAQPASTSKIEVLEFFFYECSHCFHLHPQLAAWDKTKASDVEISYVPTMFRDSTEPLAHAYYALQGLGQIKQLDDAIYQAIHVNQVGLYDLASISAFVGQHGVDRAKFDAAYNSFSVQSKVTRAKQMIRSYGIQGTPTLVVDGQYLITGLQPEDTIRVLNDVIAKVRKERGKKH
jgi:thiol:disulfide interchange protein DsbA